jgi:AraC family transcriptional regulator
MQQRSLQQVRASVALIFLIHGLIIATWASRKLARLVTGKVGLRESITPLPDDGQPLRNPVREGLPTVRELILKFRIANYPPGGAPRTCLKALRSRRDTCIALPQRYIKSDDFGQLRRALGHIHSTTAWSKRMRVELFRPDSVTEPRHWVRHDQAFAMMLGPGSIEWGSKRSALEKFDYAAGDLALCDRHIGEWVGLMKVPHLQLGISDAALMASSDGAYGEVELRPSRKFANSRLSALVAAAHAEMVAGFPSGRLFLDSVEQAMAVALVKDRAVRHRLVQMHRGGLGSARLRKIKELVQAEMEDDLSLDEMAQSVGLSTAHFARMFRKSTGQSPHQFVLRQRIERGKAMLRAPDARVLDVAVACGFKTQQHFAQAFRDVCGVSPTEYRQDFIDSEDTSLSLAAF